MGPGGTTPRVKPLLVILSECAGLPLTRTQAEYDAAVFGPAAPNIAGLFSEMSNGKFTFSRAAVAKVGPLDCTTPITEAENYRRQLEGAANADGTGGFEFKNYDTDANGTVSGDELALLGLSTFDRNGGKNLGFTNVTVFPGTARQVHVNVMWCYAGDATPLDNWAHELCHGSCGMRDLYGSNCRGLYQTLASCTAGGTTPTNLVHLDPWHKIRMGWVVPLIYDLRDFPAGVAIALRRH